MELQRDPVGLDLLRHQVRLGRCQLAALARGDLVELDLLAAERELLVESMSATDLADCPSVTRILGELRACDERLETGLAERTAFLAERLATRRQLGLQQSSYLYAFV